jgi:hypothetical protein
VNTGMLHRSSARLALLVMLLLPGLAVAQNEAPAHPQPTERTQNDAAERPLPAASSLLPPAAPPPAQGKGKEVPSPLGAPPDLQLGLCDEG